MQTKTHTLPSIINGELRHLLLKQKYQIHGNVTIKKCRWTHNALRQGRFCYKRFYGIMSHRCIQASPTILCNHECVFCWRIQGSDLERKSLYRELISQDNLISEQIFDAPEEVVKGLFWGWKRIVSGYKPFVNPETYQEALKPKHVALSLTGEPLLYPYMPELIRLLKNEGLSVFVVTNGTFPERILELSQQESLPTQLYVTLPAPDKKTYLRTCKPFHHSQWESILETLEIFRELSCRTVTRLTLAENINLKNAEGYSRLIEIAEPDFIETKGVVHVGYSQKRIPRTAMPNHESIMNFARSLEQNMAYNIAAEAPESLLAILSKGTPLQIPNLADSLSEI